MYKKKKRNEILLILGIRLVAPVLIILILVGLKSIFG